MELKITSEQKEGYLLIKTLGSIDSMDGYKVHAKLSYEEAEKHTAKNIILDMMKMDIQATIIDQTELVAFYDEYFPPKVRTWKVAIVINPKFKKLADFWELYANNRGYHWKACYSVEEAEKYIAEK